MTQIAVQNQVDSIKKATEKALQSKETAIKFLTDAGILKEEKPPKAIKEKGKK
jgi:hypothetical protein